MVPIAGVILAIVMTVDLIQMIADKNNLHDVDTWKMCIRDRSYKALQAEIETLIQEKNSGYNDYRAKREEYRRLQTVKGNIDQILHRERKPVKRQEQER